MTMHKETFRILHYLVIDGFEGVQAAGPSGKAMLHYSQTLGKLRLAKDGGAFSEIPALSSSTFNNVQGTPVITIAAQVSNARVVSIQLTDINGVNLAYSAIVRVWISDAAAGAQSGTAPGGTVAISGGVGAIIDTHTAKLSFSIASSAAGLIQLSVDDAGSGHTWFVNVAGADGRVTSGTAVWA